MTIAENPGEKKGIIVMHWAKRPEISIATQTGLSATKHKIIEFNIAHNPFS